MTDREEILSRYLDIQKRLNEASGAWGGVEILPVTKTVPPERILCLKDAGVQRIGENRVQEAMDKLDALGEHFDFHIIGRVQTNKCKYLTRFAACIQSLDRLELARELQKALTREKRTIEAYVEVNIGSDPNKAGISKEEAPAFLRELRAFENIRVTGLMTIAPITEEAEGARVYFREMRRLFDDMKNAPGGEGLVHLSMGMSKDCLIAAQEGATEVRVGSYLFGQREYLQKQQASISTIIGG